jgi:hypothetical protein
MKIVATAADILEGPLSVPCPSRYFGIGRWSALYRATVTPPNPIACLPETFAL